MNANAILLLSCPDRKGITATVTNFVFKNNGNIEHADQHIDKQANTLFMRVEWSLENFKISKSKITQAFGQIAGKFGMEWNLYFSDETPRIAIFVSCYMHCLQDLLWRYKSKQLKCTIPLIISNHPQAGEMAEDFGIKFFQIPVTEKNKLMQEEKEIEILKRHDVEVVVLARYGQILSRYFIKRFHNRVINIHHSFLPAFAGEKPYAQAFRKGVKIIGATSHYATEELDAGPIIEQDTVRISHRDSLNDLVRKGEDLERVVLSRALRWHLERKILVYDNKTVIFD